MHPLGFALAALIGLSLGLLGGGGSILTVPVLVYALGVEPKTGIAMSLPIVGITSLVGAIGHWRAGNVQLRTAATFGGFAMVGSFLGARAAAYVAGTTQLATLAVVMLVAAIAMLRGASRPRRAAEPAVPEGSATIRPLWQLLAVALGVGGLTGIIGIGGGFLIVPALVLLGGVPMKHAIGTSLVVIAMNSASGFVGYLGSVAIPWGTLAVFTAIAIGGILLGTSLVRFISAAALKRGFALFLLVIGVLVLYQNRAVFTRRSSSQSVPASVGRDTPGIPSNDMVTA